MNTSFLGFVVLLFVATVLMIEGLYFFWHSRHGASVKRMKQRVRAAAPGGNASDEQLSILKRRTLSDSPMLLGILRMVPRVNTLDRLLQQSGSTWSVGRFLGYSAVLSVCGVAVGIVLHQGVIVLLVLGCVCALLPLLIVRRKRSKRTAVLEQQLPEAADLVARALRAGHSFTSALGMVGDEMPQPLGAEFKLAFDEINFGVSMNDALLNMVNRVPVDDLRYFVIAVLIQREAGGNLAEILGNISSIIRERLKLLGKVRVLSAEGRLSAWILSLLPFVLAGVISLISPKLMSILWTDPGGIQLAGVACVCMLFGILWTRSIVRIRV
ncbi:type II secretion system F family protein [Paraburkholderia sp. GAS334]|jgi:tight adherence protein B|uniref:type II secretion system F family protein n=1 Tax=unclassified Paraburkholderia TaxID=2615204 RepID=UPI003D249E39